MIGMKVATVCTPPPTPSASSAVSHGGLPMPSSTWARAVDQQRAGELVEEVDEGAAEVDGEQEQQIHHREKDRNAGQPVQHHPIDAVGHGPADDAFAPHRLANQRVGEAVAAVGDEDVAVFVGAIGRLLGDPVGGLANARRHHGPRALVALQQLDRQPLHVGGRRDGDALEQRLEFGQRVLDLRAVAQVDLRHPALARRPVDLGAQMRDAVAAAGDHRHHRTAEPCGQRVDIDADAPVAGDVHHVERHQHRHPHFQQLRRQVQVPLEVGGVEDIDDEVRLAGQHELAGDPLVERGHRGHGERVDARQVDDRDLARGRPGRSRSCARP